MSKHHMEDITGITLGNPIAAWSHGDVFSDHGDDDTQPGFVRLSCRRVDNCTGAIDVEWI